MSELFRRLGADTNPADDDSPITTTPDVRLPAQAIKKKKRKRNSEKREAAEIRRDGN